MRADAGLALALVALVPSLFPAATRYLIPVSLGLGLAALLLASVPSLAVGRPRRR